MTTALRTRDGDLVNDGVLASGSDTTWTGEWPRYPADPMESEPILSGGPYDATTRRGRILRDLRQHPSGVRTVNLALAVEAPHLAVEQTLLELATWRLVQEAVNVPGVWRITCRGRSTVMLSDERPAVPPPRRRRTVRR